MPILQLPKSRQTQSLRWKRELPYPCSAFSYPLSWRKGGTRVLVSPAVSNPVQSVLLKDICKEANVSDSTKASVNDVLKYLGFEGGVDGTSIDVNQAF